MGGVDFTGIYLLCSFKEILCEDNAILWISKLCPCVSVRWCFIELV